MCIRDSFRTSYLYQHILKPIQHQLFSLSFFILGDSPYAIESFILPPFDNAKPKTAEDAFNYYHSSACITVECAFGEINRRWGIFWSPIAYSLYNTCIICEGAMHLHNFLVDYRNMMNNAREEIELENEIFHNDCLDNAIISKAITNGTDRPGGRPTDEEILSRQNGLVLRDHLKLSLANHNMCRKER